MMSGIEAAAGLVLGVLPLVISAIEHYDDMLRPFLSYRNFTSRAPKKFMTNSRQKERSSVLNVDCYCSLLHSVILFQECLIISTIRHEMIKSCVNDLMISWEHQEQPVHP